MRRQIQQKMAEIFVTTLHCIFLLTNILSFTRAQGFSSFQSEPTIDGSVSYFSLINQIQQWQRANPTICGQDTSTCGVQHLVSNFEACSNSRETSVDPRKNTRIINGCSLATQATVGWSVAVLLNTTLCGGTLLGFGASNRPPARSLGVIVGATDLRYREPGARLYALESFARHPNFNSDIFANDTAILKLAQPVPFNGPDGVRPACLADRPSSILHKDCLLAGYGVSSPFRDNSGSGFLRYSVLAVQDLHKCLTLAEDTDGGPVPGSISSGPTPSWLFCATGKRMNHISDSCRGDSGSGVLCKSPEGRWTLQGVVSFGPQQCAQIPGFYADAFNLGIRNPSKLNTATSSAGAKTITDRCSATKLKPASSLSDFPALRPTYTVVSRPSFPFAHPPPFYFKGQPGEKKTVDLLADLDEASMKRPAKNITTTAVNADLLARVLSDK